MRNRALARPARGLTLMELDFFKTIAFAEGNAKERAA
jgi:hypothetical protein